MTIGTPPPGGYWAVNIIFGLIVGLGFIAIIKVVYGMVGG